MDVGEAGGWYSGSGDALARLFPLCLLNTEIAASPGCTLRRPRRQSPQKQRSCLAAPYGPVGFRFPLNAPIWRKLLPYCASLF